ncbi:MAG: hypothetical protein AMJ64_01340 [Betaproteobacteria bacterium SG8_39]|nr:MAG: hypothetical protein AMJ64_01340 [Betaproteobacteria bacterium SG8_39]
MDDHWLARASTIRLLWRVFIVVLAVTVLAEFAVDLHPHFAIEGVFGFGAWYGFLACAALIVAAKALGVLLKRPDRYYQEDERG